MFSAVFRTIAFSAALCMMCGCGSKESSADVPYSQLADADALVSVNGVAYTKGELERDVGIRVDLTRLSFEAADDSRLERLREEFRAQAVDQFVSRELLLLEAKRLRLEVTTDDMLQYQEQFARGLSGRLPVSFDAIGSVLGQRVTAFRNSLKKDALSSLVAQRIRDAARKVATVSAEEAGRTIAQARASNEAFSITNRMAYAAASNAWQEVRSGADIAAVGARLHAENRYYTYIPACDTAEPAAQALAKGEVSPPLPQERGLAIFKANDAPGVGGRYSCLFFALAPIYVIESVEETRKTLLESKVARMYEARLNALRESADVRYPNGRPNNQRNR